MRKFHAKNKRVADVVVDDGRADELRRACSDDLFASAVRDGESLLGDHRSTRDYFDRLQGDEPIDRQPDREGANENDDIVHQQSIEAEMNLENEQAQDSKDAAQIDFDCHNCTGWAITHISTHLRGNGEQARW